MAGGATTTSMLMRSIMLRQGPARYVRASNDIRARSMSGRAIPHFRYLSAWFCPFAHRATIALEHHKGRVSYEWIEALGWERRENKDGSTETSHEWWSLPSPTHLCKEYCLTDWGACRYHWKSDELKASNPSGLVPTLIDKDGRAIFESLVCIDFVDAVSGASGKDCLVSEDPVEAARARVWADRVNRECCSPYYSVLVRTDDAERATAPPGSSKKTTFRSRCSGSDAAFVGSGKLSRSFFRVSATSGSFHAMRDKMIAPRHTDALTRIAPAALSSRRLRAPSSSPTGSSRPQTWRCSRGRCATTCSSTTAARTLSCRATTRPSLRSTAGATRQSRSRRSRAPSPTTTATSSTSASTRTPPRAPRCAVHPLVHGVVPWGCSTRVVPWWGAESAR
jgi:hypothetical protein